ncbi:PREDICTED: uncharacterized protein LOC109149202 [Ipomoea nil]|uniref:uncharacterized protein LOC109149202 n=1 Tax=Ipomoea nil TaxID=35883 RepID=UPI000900C361|nr:PREDICTED: uncharacterized protein LOC109149202 [Ipomoea nil]
MFSPCICGSSHLDLQTDEDEMYVLLSPSSTPKRSKKGTFYRGREIKNPYANRGLDKFSALLADLQNLKQKIYTQMGSDDISFVRFAFLNSNDVKPIIVKSKNKKQGAADKDEVEQNVVQSTGEAQETGGEEKRLGKSVSWKKMNYVMKWENWKKPRYYLPVAIILILALLAVYGRTFAVMCTSIGWYAIPTIRESSSSSLSSRKQKRKRDFSRKLSCKTVVSTNSSNGRGF